MASVCGGYLVNAIGYRLGYILTMFWERYLYRVSIFIAWGFVAIRGREAIDLGVTNGYGNFVYNNGNFML